MGAIDLILVTIALALPFRIRKSRARFDAYGPEKHDSVRIIASSFISGLILHTNMAI